MRAGGRTLFSRQTLDRASDKDLVRQTPHFPDHSTALFSTSTSNLYRFEISDLSLHAPLNLLETWTESPRRISRTERWSLPRSLAPRVCLLLVLLARVQSIPTHRRLCVNASRIQLQHISCGWRPALWRSRSFLFSESQTSWFTGSMLSSCSGENRCVTPIASMTFIGVFIASPF